jgi:hypothetical protein
MSAGAPLMLRDGWQVQTSTGQPAGAEISKAGFAATGWYKTSIPACVSGVLAQAGVYPVPFVDLNLLSSLRPRFPWTVGTCRASRPAYRCSSTMCLPSGCVLGSLGKSG